METNSRPGALVNWTPFVFGSIAGTVPWIAIVIYLAGAGSGMPTFVYGIFVSIFVLFNCFAINQWLQYRARGRWAEYLHGERVYIALSLIAKSLLAWPSADQRAGLKRRHHVPSRALVSSRPPLRRVGCRRGTAPASVRRQRLHRAFDRGGPAALQRHHIIHQHQ
jgi:hypothetical protein